MKPARAIVDRDVKPVNGLRVKRPCSVCGRPRSVGANGLVKLHRAHGAVCDGSVRPPRAPKAKPIDEWARARKATLARDGHQCRKCAQTESLEVHHIQERVFGGTNELDNLITLCSECHAEWTFCEPPIAFTAWLGTPPARVLVAIFANRDAWRPDISAAAFRSRLLVACSLALGERARKAGGKP